MNGMVGDNDNLWSDNNLSSVEIISNCFLWDNCDKCNGTYRQKEET